MRNRQRNVRSPKCNVDRLTTNGRTSPSAQGKENQCIQLSVVDLTATYDCRAKKQQESINSPHAVTVYSDVYKQYLQRQKHSQGTDISKQSRSVTHHARPWTVFSNHIADEYNVKYQILGQ